MSSRRSAPLYDDAGKQLGDKGFAYEQVFVRDGYADSFHSFDETAAGWRDSPRKLPEDAMRSLPAAHSLASRTVRRLEYEGATVALTYWGEGEEGLLWLFRFYGSEGKMVASVKTTSDGARVVGKELP